MQLEARKYLFEVKQAADLIAAFSGGKRFADYEQDAVKSGYGQYLLQVLRERTPT